MSMWLHIPVTYFQTVPPPGRAPFPFQQTKVKQQQQLAHSIYRKLFCPKLFSVNSEFCVCQFANMILPYVVPSDYQHLVCIYANKLFCQEICEKQIYVFSMKTYYRGFYRLYLVSQFLQRKMRELGGATQDAIQCGSK